MGYKQLPGLLELFQIEAPIAAQNGFSGELWQDWKAWVAMPSALQVFGLGPWVWVEDIVGIERCWFS